MVAEGKKQREPGTGERACILEWSLIPGSAIFGLSNLEKYHLISVSSCVEWWGNHGFILWGCDSYTRWCLSTLLVINEMLSKYQFLKLNCATEGLLLLPPGPAYGPGFTPLASKKFFFHVRVRKGHITWIGVGVIPSPTERKQNSMTFRSWGNLRGVGTGISATREPRGSWGDLIGLFWSAEDPWGVTGLSEQETAQACSSSEIKWKETHLVKQEIILPLPPSLFSHYLTKSFTYLLCYKERGGCASETILSSKGSQASTGCTQTLYERPTMPRGGHCLFCRQQGMVVLWGWCSRQVLTEGKLFEGSIPIPEAAGNGDTSGTVFQKPVVCHQLALTSEKGKWTHLLYIPPHSPSPQGQKGQLVNKQVPSTQPAQEAGVGMLLAMRCTDLHFSRVSHPRVLLQLSRTSLMVITRTGSVTISIRGLIYITFCSDGD